MAYTQPIHLIYSLVIGTIALLKAVYKFKCPIEAYWKRFLLVHDFDLRFSSFMNSFFDLKFFWINKTSIFKNREQFLKDIFVDSLTYPT